MTLFELIAQRPPEAFRLSACRTILREAERCASARAAMRVEVSDVVHACLIVTPEPFRVRMFDFLRSRGLIEGLDSV